MSNAKVEWHGDEWYAKVMADFEGSLDKAAERMAEDTRQSMQGPKSGTTYLKKPTRSSAPGETPAVQTSDLQESIQWVKDGPLRRVVGTNLPYGRYLELGTANIAPRPWLRPAFLRLLANWKKYIE